jgi:hypothetical protein
LVIPERETQRKENLLTEQQRNSCDSCKLLPPAISVVINSNGLSFDYCGFRITIPEGAFMVPTTVTFRLSCAKSVNMKMIDGNGTETAGRVITPILQCLPSGLQLSNGKQMKIILPHCIYPLKDQNLTTIPVSIQEDGSLTQFPAQNLSGDLEIQTDHFSLFFSLLEYLFFPKTQKRLAVFFYAESDHTHHTLRLCLCDDLPHIIEIYRRDLGKIPLTQNFPVKYGFGINVTAEMQEADDCTIHPTNCR